MQHPLWLGYEMWLNMTVIKLSTKVFFFMCAVSSHALAHTITQKTGLYSVTHIRTQTHPMETTSAWTYILSPIILLGIMFLLPVTRTLPINDVQIPLRVCVSVGLCGFFKEVRDIAHMARWPGTSIYYTREVKLTVVKAVWKYRPETRQLLTLHRAESVCMIHRGQINSWQIELVSQN